MRLKVAPLLRDATRPYRAGARQAGACAALLGLASVVLLALSGWFLAAAAAAGLAGIAVAQAFNYMLPAAAIRMFAIIRTGARYGERMTGHAAALAASARLREALFGAVTRQAPGRALALAAGEASAHLAQDVGVIEAMLVRRSAPWQLVASVGAALAMAALGGWAPVAGTAGVVLLTLWAIEVASRRLARHGRAVQDHAAALKREAAMLAQATPELRAYGLEGWAEERLDGAARLLEQSQQAATTALGAIDALQLGGVAVAASLAFVLAAGSGAPIAALAALGAVMAIDGLAPHARERATRGGLEAADTRLGALVDPAVAESAAAPAAVAMLPALDIGQRVALVGPSGCGKTTLVEQLLALRPVAPGALTLDGRDLAATAPERLRALFAWCPQDAALLAGTVCENLRLADPAADDGAMWAALRDAALSDRIERAGGLDYWIGENGARLSGGERRRLALARALLSDAPCLLLDEPTEGLDAETEALVIEGIARRLERSGQGLILVSHRPAPLRLAQSIVDLSPVRETETVV